MADQNEIEYEECVEQSPVRHRIHCQQRRTDNIEHYDLPFPLRWFFESFFVVFRIRTDKKWRPLFQESPQAA